MDGDMLLLNAGGNQKTPELTALDPTHYIDLIVVDLIFRAS